MDTHPATTPGPADTVEFHRFGKPSTDNVGIVALRADREFDTDHYVLIHVSIDRDRGLNHHHRAV